MNWTVTGLYVLGGLAAVGVSVFLVGAFGSRKDARSVLYVLGAIVLVALVAGLVSGLNLRVVAG